MPAVVVVHGGAGTWTDSSRLSDGISGCERAASVGATALKDGALPAVISAVKVLEEHPAFNAGFGSTLTREGTVELDAAVMTGDLRFGAIAACPPIESAIEGALSLYKDGETSILVGWAALMFAGARGIKPLDPESLIAPRSVEQWQLERDARSHGKTTIGSGTVGAVAVDGRGELAAATSTGGILWKRVGRVGDTPLPGAGTYADDAAGAAASATGHGEAILRVLVCREAVDRVGRGEPVDTAVLAAIDILARRARGRGGLILINKGGEYFAGRNTEAMPWAACSPGADPLSGS